MFIVKFKKKKQLRCKDSPFFEGVIYLISADPHLPF